MPSHTTAPLIRLLRYGRLFQGRIWLATLYSILNKLFDLAPPVLIGMAVDIVVNQQASIFASFGFPEVSAAVDTGHADAHCLGIRIHLGISAQTQLA